jgi:rare lipoprotein A
MGSRLKVTCAKTGKSVTVRVNDRGPYAHNRVIDLSKAAARELGMLNAGLTDVSIELLPSA